MSWLIFLRLDFHKTQSIGVAKITNHLEELSVFEKTADSFKIEYPNVQLIHGEANRIDPMSKILHLKGCKHRLLFAVNLSWNTELYIFFAYASYDFHFTDIMMFLLISDGSEIEYGKLCVCTGAQPKLIALHPNVICLRDLQSISDLASRLSRANKVAVIGNGGIAVELVHLVRVQTYSFPLSHCVCTLSFVI
jgi:NADH dehydrogenase FAD-containing subunit